MYSPEDTLSASLLRTSPTGPLSPPVPNMRPGAPGGNLTPDALAALLSGGAPAPGAGMPPPYGAGPSQPPQQAGASNGERCGLACACELLRVHAAPW